MRILIVLRPQTWDGLIGRESYPGDDGVCCERLSAYVCQLPWACSLFTSIIRTVRASYSHKGSTPRSMEDCCATPAAIRPKRHSVVCSQPISCACGSNEQCQSKFCVSHHIRFEGDRTGWEHRMDDCVTGHAIVHRAVVGLYLDSPVVRAGCQGIHALGCVTRDTVVLPPETRLQWRLSIPMQRWHVCNKWIAGTHVYNMTSQ